MCAMSADDEKCCSSLLSDYILSLSNRNKAGIEKDYKTIRDKLCSSWFSTKLILNEHIETLELPFSHLSFKSSTFFMQQLRALNVPQNDNEIIKQSIQEKIKSLRDLGSVHLIETLSETFYCHLNGEWRKKSFIGLVIIGFIPIASNKENVKLLCCGHCESIDPSSFKKITIKNNETKLIKNYIIYQLLKNKIGYKQNKKYNPFIGNLNINKNKNKNKMKNNLCKQLKLDSFHPNMSKKEITRLLGLKYYPNYKMDSDGYIMFERGLMIKKQYILLNRLGKGTFSNVFESIDCYNKRRCAIKIIRNAYDNKRAIDDASKTELQILRDITNTNGSSTANCIHLLSHFEYKNHPCFIFKLYGLSIYQLSIHKKNRHKPFPLCIIRSFIYQICETLQFLHGLGIIYTDLKAENMVLVNDKLYSVDIDNKTYLIPYDSRIKMIDFGSAVYEAKYDKNNAKTLKFKNGYNYLIQTRYYRAPQVILGIPWKRQVDIWSFGCIILEWLYGEVIFDTFCDIDHLNKIQQMIGSIPTDLINQCLLYGKNNKYKQLFNDTTNNNHNRLNLNNAKISKYKTKRLDTYFNLNQPEQQNLYDLISKCLKWKAIKRINADKLLKHKYFIYIKNKKLFTHQHKFVLSKPKTTK